nr:MAG TPA: hypothetical protein [Caudoviricetes sp.]DAK99798.1 MAG TPA: hypothetical protein [Caudoviricetes sp.]
MKYAFRKLQKGFFIFSQFFFRIIKNIFLALSVNICYFIHKYPC